MLLLANDGIELGYSLSLGLANTLGIVLGPYESEGDPEEEDDGSALDVSLMLGIFETEGAALELGFNEADGLMLLLANDGISLGSALSLGLALILGIVLGAYKPEGDTDEPDGYALVVSLILGILDTDGAVLELGFNDADGPLLLLAIDGSTLSLGLALILGIVLGGDPDKDDDGNALIVSLILG